jgi:drug/metabolite transporter (DMT)-like permease
MSLSLVISEALLNLYPVLIKSVNADLLTHTAVRMITSALLSYPMITVSVGQVLGNLSSQLSSLLYLIHIYASYLGFRYLEVGVALTIFYLYPLFNVLIKFLLSTQPIDYRIIGYCLVSLVGVYLIATTLVSASPTGSASSGTKYLVIGVLALIISALTESLIYTFHKVGQETNPFNMLFSSCLSGSIIISIVWWLTHSTGTSNHNGISQLIIANAILGVGGYLLRFYSISGLSTEWYSMVSFIGIIFGYLYGWLLYGEMINSSKVIGTLLIMGSLYGVKRLGYD